jgi:extracellular elastinolytic metalloproteinase
VDHAKAQENQKIEKQNFISSPNSYNVYPLKVESPIHGNRSIVIDPSNDDASPFGWHDTNGSEGFEHTTTKGNNVEAKEDIANNNETTAGAFADGGSSLTFDFPHNLSLPPASNLNSAITNLFYWNNVMHDVWYQYGFDESAGNFQSNNYGKGGLQNDFVYADALDGGGTNNANFSSPVDGNKPRMQMYLWTAPASSISFTVNSPSGIEGSYTAVKASFGAQNYNISGNLELGDPLIGCPINNGSALSGKIAVLDRGGTGCEFGTKCLNAQNAGAIAVVICNNVNSAPIAMSAGANGASVTIPCVMVSQANCNTIKLQIPNIVNVTMIGTGGIQIDGDFDNGIIAHEYGHGISIRLTGGAGNSSCLNNAEQMGEGWSDWFGMMLTLKATDLGETGRGIGTYALGQPNTGVGIRQYRYSTNMTTNPHTYANVTSVAIPHGIGSVWCAMLWEMTWALIDIYGIDEDYYYGQGGNNIAMALVTEALKLQPCSPGFVDGRNAILAADDALYGGIHKCLIYKAFAKRGLGFSASQGLSSSRTDGTQAFDLPTFCCNQVYVKDNSGAGSLREAINCVAVGGTVNFAPYLANRNIKIDNGLTINKNVVILNSNTEKVNINSSDNATTITIGNFDVYMENLNIVGGVNPSTSTLINNGVATFKNVTLSNNVFLPNSSDNTVINNNTINVIGELKTIGP